jgi:hypothetical protein
MSDPDCASRLTYEGGCAVAGCSQSHSSAHTLSRSMSNADFAYEDIVHVGAVVQGGCAAKLPASATLACADVQSFEEAEAVLRSIAHVVRSAVLPKALVHSSNMRCERCGYAGQLWSATAADSARRLRTRTSGWHRSFRCALCNRPCYTINYSSRAQELALNGMPECRRTADRALQTSQWVFPSDQHHRVCNAALRASPHAGAPCPLHPDSTERLAS